MKLTGKAKKLLLEWCIENDILWLDDAYPSSQWGVIQDWADSEGVTLDIETNYIVQTNTVHGYLSFVNGLPVGKRNTKTRQEARNAAIKKLNQIINER